MAMEHHAQMRDRSFGGRSAFGAVTAVLLCLAGTRAEANVRPVLLAAISAPFLQSQSSGDTSSSQKSHRKAPRRTTTPDDQGPDPELSKAEELIQKQDYAGAAPLVRRVVADDPDNYVAWFDLGFLQNALGKPDESIAAYRKSVAAKPDIFESNLNLGLMLAKSRQPEAEEFLRTATRLKPESHVDEGQARAWLAMARLKEESDPAQALEAYHQAAALQPKDPEPRLSAGKLLE